MNFLIDSDVVSALSNPKSLECREAISFLHSFSHPPVLHLSMITVLEVEFNIASFKDKDNKKVMRNVLEDLKSDFNILNLDFNQARIYGELKQGMRNRTGINKNALKRHNIDIALASVAIANDCTLISRDKIYSEHLQVINPDLKHQIW